MEQDPKLILWQLEYSTNNGKSVLRFKITKIFVLEPDTLSDALPNHVLNRLGIKIPYIDWNIKEYRSGYIRDNTEDLSWEDRWRQLWLVEINFASIIHSINFFKSEDTFLYDGATVNSFAKEEKQTNCLVIADFISKAEAEKAKRDIVQYFKNSVSISVGEPQISTAVYGDEDLLQLVIDLGSFDLSFYKSGAAYALSIEGLCKSNGGYINFEDRINNLDEIYYEDGIE